eukprot:4073113-Amphidinium_carterae.1
MFSQRPQQSLILGQEEHNAEVDETLTRGESAKCPSDKTYTGGESMKYPRGESMKYTCRAFCKGPRSCRGCAFFPPQLPQKLETLETSAERSTFLKP